MICYITIITDFTDNSVIMNNKELIVSKNVTSINDKSFKTVQLDKKSKGCNNE